MRSDRRYQVVDGQTDFSGGMRMVGKLADNEYRYGKNIIVRDGSAENRPGLRRAFHVNQSGFNDAFYFNEDNVRYNDTAHTGFWFPFRFVGSAWGDIQGMTFFRFNDETITQQLVVSDGTIFVQKAGFVEEVSASETIATTEEITFVQGNNIIVMFRSGDANPLYWDGADKTTGFQSFTSPGTSNRIPLGENGVYLFGRLGVIEDDNLNLSDSLDFDTYDYTHQTFGIEVGDGDSLVQVIPFKESFALCFKKRHIYVLSGINSWVDTDGGHYLDEYVERDIVSNEIGMVGKYAYAVAGEQIYFLSYRGIDSVYRVEQGRIMGQDLTLSAPIQPIIDRINWTYAVNACGIAFKNYLLFAVPLDDSIVNNAVIVYDMQANGGKGAWVSVWESQMMVPTQFFVDDDKLYFLNNDGALKLMWSDDPWDTEDVLDDVPAYSATVVCKEGQRYLDTTNNANVIYRAITESLGASLTDTTYFTEETDPYNLFHVESEIWTRFYNHGDDVSPKRYGRCQLNFLSQNPNLTVDIETDNFQSVDNIFSDVTYSQNEYDSADPSDFSDWNPCNKNLDFNTPYRQDYTVLLDTNGYVGSVWEVAARWSVAELSAAFTVQELIDLGIPLSGVISGMFFNLAGLYLNVYTPHTLRFIPRVLKNTGYSLRIKNTQGKLKIKSILSAAQQSYFAKKDE